MIDEQILNDKIEQARLGNDDSIRWLSEEAKEKLHAYIFRVTLDNDLADDLTQETLLQMIQSIGSLNEVENFWPWLYRIAQNKIHEHFRSTKKDSAIREDEFYKDFLSRRGDYYQDQSMRELLQEDLLKPVMIAMKQLSQKHRAVLSLRCFDNLSYAEIAETFESSEVSVRVLFLRARKALRKKLSNQGLDKNMMLMSLGLFGRLTLTPETASSLPESAISNSIIKVGPAAVIYDAIFSKKGVAAIAVIILLLFLLRKDSSIQEPSAGLINLPARNEISSMHFTVQVFDNDPEVQGSLSKGAYERWFYFPEGVDGPAFMRMQRYSPDLQQKQCAWLENEQANYYYDSGSKIVYITNCRVCWSNLKVRRLPTDSEEFINFLEKVEGEYAFEREYKRDKKTGLVISSVDNRFENAQAFVTEYKFNTLDKEVFKYKWDEPVLIQKDDRDQMRKRGWTYFYIDGEIAGREISGKGRVPFFYNTCKEYPAWLEIEIGDDCKIVDCVNGAQMLKPDGTVIANYPSGTFLKGLPRPWMGLHAADTIRRDAVEQKVWFFSEWHENEEDVVITLFDKENPDSTNVIYTIGYENDIIKSIYFANDTNVKGSLEFKYLQDIEQTKQDFPEPVLSDSTDISTTNIPEKSWLINLAEDKL